MTGILLRALLICLLSLQAVALRASPMPTGAGGAPLAGEWVLPLCGGGVVALADPTPADRTSADPTSADPTSGAPGVDGPSAPVSHMDCLDCCLAAVDRAADPARAPARGIAAARLRRRLSPGRTPLGRAAPRPRSRAPPRPL
ncbi:MAG: hypothetical protein CML46_12890 [Rhodobacteraceae bacterium]|nr:hypothetical protein [Paracoccaceae bacterium]MBR27824.1 hypothetical protein [Paracoccaceae bacterium]